MPFTVTTYKSPDALQAAVGGTVTVFDSEDALGAGLIAATSPFTTTVNGNRYTLIDAPTIPNVSLRILAKGAYYTVILETA